MMGIFLDNWNVLFCIPMFVLTDNGPPFVSNLFAAFCANLEGEHLAPTTYHRQNNG